MKIPKQRKLNKFTKMIKILALVLAVIIPTVGSNKMVIAASDPESNTSSDGLVTVKKASKRVDDNKHMISLDIETKEAQDSVETVGNDIVLVFDISNSMKYNVSGSQTSGVAEVNQRITKAKEAALSFLENEKISGNKKNRYAIVTFNYYGYTTQDLTSDLDKAKRAIKNVQLSNDTSDGGTNIQAGLYHARKILSDSTNGMMILLTDGEATGSYNLNNKINSYYSVNDYSQTTSEDKNMGYNRDYTFGESAINYSNNNVLKGGSSDFSIDIRWNGQTGNRYTLKQAATVLAENEALLAKKDNKTIFTIGYTTSSSYNQILKNIATQGEGYAYSSSSDLTGIYNNIADEIVTRYNTIVKNGIVTDPMSQYVDLLNIEDGTYQNSILGILEFNQGYVVVSSENGKQKITWYVGNINKNSSAHLNYFVGVKDKYKNDIDYPANDLTRLNYNNYIDQESYLDFNIPTVKEGLPIKNATLTVKKIVTNSNEDKEFMIHVIGRDANDEKRIIYKTDLLLKNNEEIILEELPFGNYTVTETIPMEYTLTKSEAGYNREKLTNSQVIELKQIKDNNKGYVFLTNNFAHVGFFKATDEKTNFLPASKQMVKNYNVNINGNVKQTISKAPQDVIMVLDSSGSMAYDMDDDSRMAHLKKNAINFIKKLYKHNPESRVSVITFADNANTSITNGGFVKLSDNQSRNQTWYEYLTVNNNGINGIKANGGTQTDLGLYQARRQLQSATGNNNKSIILFTDGEPGNSGFATSSSYYINGYRVGAEAINQAEFIKKSGYLNNVNYSLRYNNTNYYGHANDDITMNRSNNNSNNQGNRNRKGQGLGKKLFVIGINPENTGTFDSFLNQVASDGHYTRTNNTEAMEKAFDSIFTNITTMDTDVNIRLKYDATKFKVIDSQGGELGGSGTNAYIEWTNIIDESLGTFTVNGIKFKTIAANSGELHLEIQGYKNGYITDLENANFEVVGN
ncbi:MAG: vWA domain-containing protein [Thomasclavelia sp.]|uniref:vWA domain-containing protein n=1 Tax=Thomasclavelia sp. TaxID=3025757 RepID=UPI00399F0A86